MKRDGKKRCDLTTGTALSYCSRAISPENVKIPQHFDSS
jgi:hypothetical protein